MSCAPTVPEKSPASHAGGMPGGRSACDSYRPFRSTKVLVTVGGAGGAGVGREDAGEELPMMKKDWEQETLCSPHCSSGWTRTSSVEASTEDVEKIGLFGRGRFDICNSVCNKKLFSRREVEGSLSDQLGSVRQNGTIPARKIGKLCKRIVAKNNPAVRKKSRENRKRRHNIVPRCQNLLSNSPATALHPTSCQKHKRIGIQCSHRDHPISPPIKLCITYLCMVSP